MKLTGAQIIVACLKEQGVDTVFGYPGSSVLSLYDALYEKQNEIKHVLTAHEQGAAHAADGYARVTGKIGVCIVTSGPGATNIVTGVATAYMDSVPMVVITANVPVASLGKDSFQEIDIAGITMPITKHNFIVKNIECLATTVRSAFSIAGGKRKGPVLIDITRDVLLSETEYESEMINKNETAQEGAKAEASHDREVFEEQIKIAARLIQVSEKPLVLAGGGIIAANAAEALTSLAKQCDLPVCHTLMGLGGADFEQVLSLGMTGTYGNKTANEAISSCDLLIAIGVRFSERVTKGNKSFAKHAKILHIDIDPAEINKNVDTDAFVTGDARTVIQELIKECPALHHTEWIKGLKDRLVSEKKETPKRRLSGTYILETLYQLTEGNAILATEVGLHQMLTATTYPFRRPRRLLTSGGLGTMGFGLGASIGAQTAFPEETVINIAGDGCFRMNLNELATVARYQLPVIQMVFDNSTLGMVHEMQRKEFDGHYYCTEFTDTIRYAKLAAAFGIKYYKIKSIKDTETVLKQAILSHEPAVIECVLPNHHRTKKTN